MRNVAFPALGGATPVLLCGGAIILLSLGIRHSFGIFLRPMSLDLQWPRTAFALAIGLQNLVWGLSQPFVGWIADRFGAGRVIAAGAACYAAGLAAMALSTTPLQLAASAGVLVGLGLSGTYTIVIGSVARQVSPAARSTALGTLTALASFGQFAMLPYGQALITGVGWWWALMILAANAALMLPLALALAGRPAAADASCGTAPQSASAALREAFASRGFRLLTFGFFVCGFQVVFVATHLPAYLADRGLAGDTGMLALALIGLANIPGSFLAGHLGSRWPKHRLLAALYLLRALAITAFLVAPLTPASVQVFAVALGLLWLGTVPLTSGMVAQRFGVGHLSMLFGIVYLAHQLGAFLGGWLGGYVVDVLRSYDVAWGVAVLLSLAATVANLLIDEREHAAAQ